MIQQPDPAEGEHRGGSTMRGEILMLRNQMPPMVSSCYRRAGGTEGGSNPEFGSAAGKTLLGYKFAEEETLAVRGVLDEPITPEGSPIGVMSWKASRRSALPARQQSTAEDSEST